MASRPAASRGGLTGAHYGMIVFAALTVISLGLFIFTFTRVSAAEEDARRANDRLRQFGSPPSYYADEARARNSTVFGVMTDDLRRVAGMVTGSPEDVGATIVVKSDNMLAEVGQGKPPGSFEPGHTLLTALDQLNRLYTEARQAAADAQARAASLAADVADLNQQLQAKDETFTAEIERLSKEYERAQTGMFTSLEEKDEQLANIQAALDEAEQQIQQMRRDEVALAREKDLEIIRLQTQINDLQQEIQDFRLSIDPTTVLTKADGRILRAIPGSELVYINLGAKDKLRIGMTFEVFSQAGELPEGLNGKASVEVVNVMGETSECRVTRRQPGKPIVEGDIVVNIAYERDRKPKFVVRGDFDLNYDGEIDWNGREKVTAIIEEWGGQVVPELDETVDFVVVGLAPQPPMVSRDNASELVRYQAMQERLRATEFREVVEQAQKMYIPVITQNLFLILTGHSGEGQLAQR